jgi:hypothetical protein
VFLLSCLAFLILIKDLHIFFILLPISTAVSSYISPY